MAVMGPYSYIKGFIFSAVLLRNSTSLFKTKKVLFKERKHQSGENTTIHQSWVLHHNQKLNLHITFSIHWHQYLVHTCPLDGSLLCTLSPPAYDLSSLGTDVPEARKALRQVQHQPCRDPISTRSATPSTSRPTVPPTEMRHCTLIPPLMLLCHHARAQSSSSWATTALQISDKGVLFPCPTSRSGKTIFRKVIKMRWHLLEAPGYSYSAFPHCTAWSLRLALKLD